MDRVDELCGDNPRGGPCSFARGTPVIPNPILGVDPVGVDRVDELSGDARRFYIVYRQVFQIP